jgi:hypothetical protein
VRRSSTDLLALTMRQAGVDHVVKGIEAEKFTKYRGRARVSLEHLYFPVHHPRDLDRSNVARLKDVFLREGVRRSKPENHVPAIVSLNDLSVALACSGKSLSDLVNGSQDNPPRLTFPPNYLLRCLHGKHRIAAAKESTCLRDDNRWWTVTFYLDGRACLSALKIRVNVLSTVDLSEGARRSLVDDYSNSKKFPDGLILRKIVEYESADAFSEKHWWSWLTDCKTDILGRVLKHRGFRAALRRLCRTPALLDDLNITIWHRIIATRSDEVSHAVHAPSQLTQQRRSLSITSTGSSQRSITSWMTTTA